MGSQRVRWTLEEEASLRGGVDKYGVGKWRSILNDPQFHSTLCHRSNVDLKDKWRNMTSPTISSGSHENGKTALKVDPKYNIAPEPTSPQSPKVMLLEDLHKESKVAAELARKATLKAEEAAAAAGRAIAEAEATMDVVEAAAREAEVEAYAKAIQAAFLALKNQNATKSVTKA